VGYALETRGEHPVPEDPMKLLERMGYTRDVMWVLSGSTLPEDKYLECLDSYLSRDDVRTFLDLAVFMSDRVDSLAEDGNAFIMPTVYEMCRSVLGLSPNLRGGLVQGLAVAIAEEAGRRRRWGRRAPAACPPSRA
jgi:hypothetical protein